MVVYFNDYLIFTWRLYIPRQNVVTAPFSRSKIKYHEVDLQYRQSRGLRVIESKFGILTSIR